MPTIEIETYCGRVFIHHEECVVKWAEQQEPSRFHALLSDPPYHLSSGSQKNKGFLGQTWDGGDISFQPETWAKLGNLLYPGAFLFTFASTRGWHRQGVALEDAGLVFHPSVAFFWCFSTGFPKATRVDTQIDRAHGVERPDRKQGGHLIRIIEDVGSPDVPTSEHCAGEPVTDEARIWVNHRYGGQALAPSFEPILCAQRPYEGRPIENIRTTGAGTLNIGGGRFGEGVPLPYGRVKHHGITTTHQGGLHSPKTDTPVGSVDGRWPPNCAMDTEMAQWLSDQYSKGCDRYFPHFDPEGDETVCLPFYIPKPNRAEREEGCGDLPVLTPKRTNPDPEKNEAVFVPMERFNSNKTQYVPNQDPQEGETVCLPFYIPKPNREEREAGCEDLPILVRNRVNPGGLENEPRFAPQELRNRHPTLKPIALNMHLATLLLPPPEFAPRRLLVPFGGVASEVIGALKAGWEEIHMIERDAEYCRVAEARIRHWDQKERAKRGNRQPQLSMDL